MEDGERQTHDDSADVEELHRRIAELEATVEVLSSPVPGYTRWVPTKSYIGDSERKNDFNKTEVINTPDVITVDGFTYIRATDNLNGRNYYDGMDWLKNGMKEKTVVDFVGGDLSVESSRVTCDAIYYDADGVEPIYGEYTVTSGPADGSYLILEKEKVYVIGKICPEVTEKFGHRPYFGGFLELPFTFYADWFFNDMICRSDLMHDLFYVMETLTGITHTHYVTRGWNLGED